MGFDLLYWHWIVLGIGLMLFELMLPSFTALWFGLGAIVVGLLLLFFPGMSLAAQVLLWTLFSIFFTVFWFKFLKPMSVDKTKAGLSKEAILGEVGQVLTLPNQSRRGTLRFPAPVLGADEWMFISQDELNVGDRVRVTDVSGNSLIVAKQ